MTLCPSGRHPFPIEDDTGAHCPEHGITLLWQPNLEPPQDLLTEDDQPA